MSCDRLGHHSLVHHFLWPHKLLSPSPPFPPVPPYYREQLRSRVRGDSRFCLLIPLSWQNRWVLYNDCGIPPLQRHSTDTRHVFYTNTWHVEMSLAEDLILAKNGCNLNLPPRTAGREWKRTSLDRASRSRRTRSSLGSRHRRGSPS